eukprot:116327-Chlamydomonas_euryale.AAC.1
MPLLGCNLPLFQEAGVTASASFLEHWHNGHFILYVEHCFKKLCILKREGEEVTADGAAFFEQANALPMEAMGVEMSNNIENALASYYHLDSTPDSLV